MADSSIRSFRKGLRALERQVELALVAQTECCGVTPAQCHLLLAVEEAGDAPPLPPVYSGRCLPSLSIIYHNVVLHCQASIARAWRRRNCL